MIPNQHKRDLNSLVYEATEALVSVAKANGDPEPMVWLYDALLHGEAKASESFKEAAEATDRGVQLYHEDEDQDGALPPRQASWERIRSYIQVAKDKAMLVPRDLQPDEDSAEYLAGGETRGPDRG